MARELTGKYVLAITVAAFSVIIGVNLVLAVNAVGTFPGLEVPNSYVASQHFDREREAQQALGWTVNANYDGAELRLDVLDAQGQHPAIDSLSATIGRPTHIRADLTPRFRYESGVFHAPVTLEPGIWNIHVQAVAADGTEFRQRLDHYAGAVVK
jgi:nitrogen fixation protein FixH